MYLGRGQRLSQSQLPEPKAGAGAGEAAGQGRASGDDCWCSGHFVPAGHWASTALLRYQVPKTPVLIPSHRVDVDIKMRSRL